MKYQIIGVFDRVADVWGTPQFVMNTGSAIRGFADEINRADEKNAFYNHPDDFDLFHLGSFDDAAADFELFAKPVQLAIGKSVKIRNSVQ